MSRVCSFHTALLTLAVLFFSAAGLYAQSDTSQISGFARDATGAVVPSANVTVRNEATRAERSATSNESGYYVIPNLPPGFYTVIVEAPGFKRYEKTGNKLDANLATTVNADLQVGQVTETVEVTAQVGQVQAETATVGRTVEATQIERLMLNGRNPINLALLKAGVRTDGSIARFSFGLTSGNYAINGARSQDSTIFMDGAVATRTRANGTSIGAADVDTVQEVQILTANYNAEYGRSGGGQIRMVTKSGTSDFHGSLYEYFRNSALDANSWSRNRAGLPNEAYRFNQFGYVFSGPVFIPGKFNTDRNKLFFLWSQEWVRYRRESTSIETVPSLAMRRGDFSELLNPNNTFFGRARTVNDPETGQPFPGNIIPANRLSPNGLAFLNAIPEPVPGFLQGRDNFIQTRPNPQNQRKDTISVDVAPSLNHTIRARWQNYNWNAVDAFRGGFDRAVTDWERPNMTGSVNHIWTINPTTINEFLVTASVDRVYINIDREGGRYERSRYGINYPYIFPERKEIFDKIPTIAISNFTNLDGGPYPASSTGPIYTISNSTTKILNNHTLKWGVFFERSGQNDFDQINVTGVPGGTNNQNGRFVFDDTRQGAPSTGIGIGNAAMGLFTTYAEIGQRSYTPYRGHMFEWFLQDSWRVNQKLRLELGLRHTILQPYYSLWRNMAAFNSDYYDPRKEAVLDPSTGFIISTGDRYNGIVIPGEGWPDAARGRIALADDSSFDYLFRGGAEPKHYSKMHYANFQPRVGLAYSFNDRTVFRVGGGRFFARPGVPDNIFLGGNPPLQPYASVSTGLADSPAGGTAAEFPFFFMTIDPVYQVPSAWNWNASFERQVGFNTTVSVGYVGRIGLHLERERNMNALLPGTLQAARADAGRSVDANFLRPFKGFNVIALGEMAARSEYNGLQLEVNRRFSSGLSYGFAYTYSKSFDNASGRRDRIWNPFDDTNYWGPSGFDTRHVAVINFIYDLPIFRDTSTLTGKLLGGWQVSGVTQFQTGSPFTVSTGEDFAGIGSGNESQPWQVNGDPVLPRGERQFADSASVPNFWLRTTSPDGSPTFAPPAAGTFSNQQRNQWYQPGFQSWNLALFKDFTITESQALQFRGEFYNWPNHPNWSDADTNPRNATFGKITSKSSERQLQLSLRYSF